MSQFYQGVTAGSLPPSVPTSFTTDVRDNTTTSPGTAIPDANVLQILGRDTNQNNDNGIRTDADPNNGNVVYVELTNRLTGAITTTDATPTTLMSFSLGSTPGVYYASGNITAYNTTGLTGASYSFSSSAITTGISATEIGFEIADEFEQAAMAASSFTFGTTGNNAFIEVTGIAGNTIHWSGLFTYRFVG